MLNVPWDRTQARMLSPKVGHLATVLDFGKVGRRNGRNVRNGRNGNNGRNGRNGSTGNVINSH